MGDTGFKMAMIRELMLSGIITEDKAIIIIRDIRYTANLECFEQECKEALKPKWKEVILAPHYKDFRGFEKYFKLNKKF